ncbi:hypothetical protein H0H87_012841, partial [Tephrocybe sp. NHM501043]
AGAHSRPNSPSQPTLHATLEQGDSLGVSAAVNTVIVMAQVNTAPQKLLEDALETGMDLSQFLSSLRELGITANEATDYAEFEQRTWICSKKARAHQSPTPPPLPEQCHEVGDDHENEECQQCQVDDTAWAALHAKLSAIRVIEPVINSPVQPDKKDNLPASKEEHEIPTISKTILTLAPHLGKISGENICTNPHLNKMRRLTLAYGAKRSMDVLINCAQLKRLCEPIPRSIWKKIILDHYINFEHLYTALE